MSNIFKGEFKITGSHTEIVLKLKETFGWNNYSSIINALIIGFTYKVKAKPNNLNDKVTTIFSDMFTKNKQKTDFICSLIVMLDKDFEPNEKIRLENAFLCEEFPENYYSELFIPYLLGGLEKFNDLLLKDCGNAYDYFYNLESFIESYQYNIDTQCGQDIITLCTTKD